MVRIHSALTASLRPLPESLGRRRRLSSRSTTQKPSRPSQRQVPQSARRKRLALASRHLKRLFTHERLRGPNMPQKEEPASSPAQEATKPQPSGEAQATPSSPVAASSQEDPFSQEMAHVKETLAKLDLSVGSAQKDLSHVMSRLHRLEMQSTESFLKGDLSQEDFDRRIQDLNTHRDQAMSKKRDVASYQEVDALTKDVISTSKKIDPGQSSNMDFYLRKVEGQKQRLDDFEASLQEKIEAGTLSQEAGKILTEKLDLTRSELMKKGNQIAMQAYGQSTEHLWGSVERGSYGHSLRQIEATREEMQDIRDRGLMTEKHFENFNALLDRYEAQVSKHAERDVQKHLSNVQDKIYRTDGGLSQTLSHLKHVEEWGIAKARKMIEERLSEGVLSEEQGATLTEKVDKLQQSTTRTAYWAFQREVNTVRGQLNKKQTDRSLQGHALRLGSLSNILENYGNGRFTQEQTKAIQGMIDGQLTRIDAMEKSRT